MPRTQPFLAERVIRRNLVAGDSGEMEKEGGEQPRTILAARTVDDDPAGGRSRNRSDGRGDVRTEALEEDQVDVAGRARHIGRRRDSCVELLVDLLPFSLVGPQKRHMHDLDRHRGRGILSALVVVPQIDHRADAVVDE